MAVAYGVKSRMRMSVQAEGVPTVAVEPFLGTVYVCHLHRGAECRVCG